MVKGDNEKITYLITYLRIMSVCVHVYVCARMLVTYRGLDTITKLLSKRSCNATTALTSTIACAERVVCVLRNKCHTQTPATCYEIYFGDDNMND